MKLTLRATTLLLLLLAVAMTASADSGQLTLINGGNNALGGVYVGPYNFSWTSNSQSSPLKLVCDDYSHDVYQNESWTANTSTFTALNISNLQFPGSSAVKYDEAAWLTQQIFANLGNPQTVGWMQYALWDIFTPVASGGLSAGDQSQVNYWLGQAATNYNCATCNYSNVVIYTPVPGSQNPSTDNLPQEYLGLVSVPEPGILTLLGAGLLGLVALRRRFQPVQ